MNEPQLPVASRSAEQVKAELTSQRADIERARRNLEAQQASSRALFERQRAEMEAAYRKSAAELEARLEPLRQQLAVESEKLWTLELYLGRKESIEVLRTGAPAPASEPVSVRQRVLAMDEEALVLGLDFASIEKFAAWLLADEANLDRVLPEAKGVVALIPTRRKSRSGNIFEDAHRDAANKHAHWLIRNGQRLYLMSTDENLAITDHLTPRREEFTEVFIPRTFFGLEGKPIEPGSEAWMRAEKTANARARHFMRVMMVLQGLVDRTEVFAPLRAGGVSFLSGTDRDLGYVRLVGDGQDDRLLGDGREDFATWHRRLMMRLRPGLRVIGDWHSSHFKNLERQTWNRRRVHPRMYPESTFERPETAQVHTLEQSERGMVVRFARSEKIWKRNVPVEDQPGWVYLEALVEARTRASVEVLPEDSWVLPYDLADEADIDYYLSSREARERHMAVMVPLLRAAKEAKATERAAEAPFRALIEDHLEQAGHQRDLAAELISWWKIANAYGRSLNGAGEHESRALREIVREAGLRAEVSAKGQPMIDLARREVPGAIAVGRDGQGRWLAYRPSPTTYPRERAFLDVLRLYADGRVVEHARQARPTVAQVSRLRVAWSAPQWQTWPVGSKDVAISPDDRAALVARIRSEHPLAIAITEEHNLSAYDDPPQTIIFTAYAPGEVRTQYVLTLSNQPGEVAGETVAYGGRSFHSAWKSEDSPCGPYLVWSNEEEVASEKERLEAKRAQRKEQDQAKRAAHKELERIATEAVLEPLDVSLRQWARARFVEDFGTQAEDLWEGHLENLRLRDRLPTTPAVVSMIKAVGAEVLEGMTLAEFAEKAKQGSVVPPKLDFLLEHVGHAVLGTEHVEGTNGREDR